MVMNHKDIKNQMARGVMAPLFDRLCDNNPDILDENPQVYILSLEQLQKSIYQELERILNTRPTFTAASQESRAVLDDKRKIDEPLLPTAYGLADFSWFDSAKPWTIAHLAQQIVNVNSPLRAASCSCQSKYHWQGDGQSRIKNHH